MSLEIDPDLALVRKLHLELNGSGRRTRGLAQPPAKKPKRDLAATASLGPKESISISQSGSDSRDVGKAGRRETGTLRRLTKKLPDSDSNHHTVNDEDNTTVQNARKEVLEPQVSTKIASDSKIRRQGDGDVGSRNTLDIAEIRSMGGNAGEDHAVTLAKLAAERESSSNAARVKCFYQGAPYGVSVDASACASKQALEATLREALADEPNVAASAAIDILVYNGEGKQYQCRAEESDDQWSTVLKGAKRIYLASRTAISAS